MAKQERILNDFKVVKGAANTLRVKLMYDIGGMNYFSGKSERRGLYLSVTPLTISKSSCGKFNTTSYTGFSGSKMFVKEMKRFSKKTLETFEVDADLKKRLIEIVKTENTITLSE